MRPGATRRSFRTFSALILALLAAAALLGFARSPWPALAALASFAIAVDLAWLGPVSRLAEALGRYRSGDRATRVPVPPVGGEAVALGHAFNQLADEVSTLERKLDRFLETRAEFVSLVSHELRTPLTAIGGYAKLLLSGDAGILNDTQREFLEIVNVNVDRLAHLVSDILDVEKMESGKIQVERERQDLRSVLEECHTTFVELARKKKLDFHLEMPGDAPAFLLGDRRRLVQIFMNLVSNAIKYTDRGSVTLELLTGEFAVVARVRDTGAGMSADEVAHLFQKFYRARSGLASNEVGTGLGLFLAERLVRAHGGSITVESVPGKGTTFEVTFPIHRENTIGAATTAAAGAGNELRAWIFDSNSAEVGKLAAVLQTAGGGADGRRIRVRSFSRVEDAPAMGSEGPGEVPELILLDPQAAAYDLAAVTRLRTRELNGTRVAVPLLVMSESIDTAVAFAEGASAILTKPVDDRELLIAMRDLLQARPHRVLIADRSPDLRRLLRSGLEERGMQVDEAERGSRVLELLESADYDLALLEAELPEMSGAELVREIRSRNELEGLPVLLMTREEDGASSRPELARIGASDVVDKRQGVDGMVMQVARHLGGGP